MCHMVTEFGNPTKWTGEKLSVLKTYLNVYTMALKNQPFELWYIDAFAGSGHVSGEGKGYAEGSPLIALQVEDRQFDKVFCVEKDRENITELENRIREKKLWREGVKMICGNANEEVPKICDSMDCKTRAITFLDPFNTEVKWETIACIANTKKIDMWVLFPAMAVNRMTKKRVMGSDNEIDFDEKRKKRLNDLFGDDSWKNCYKKPDSKQIPLFDGAPLPLERDYQCLAETFLKRLNMVFEDVLKKPLCLRNSKRAPLFHLCFAAGNKKGASLALRIAKSIVKEK